MDEAGIEAKGTAPLKPGLEKIAAITDHTALSTYLGQQLRADVDVMNNTNLSTDNLFGLWVAADFDQPTKYSPFILQGGLSLPNREYYLSDTPRMVAIRDAFKAHIAKVLTLAGDARRRGQGRSASSTSKTRSPTSTPRSQTPRTRKRATTTGAAPSSTPRPRGSTGRTSSKASGLSGQKTFVVWQPAAFTGEAAIVAASVPLETWKEYLAFHYIDRNSGVLPKAFVDERFAFYGKTLSGTPALQVRWKRGVAATNAGLGEAVGKLYAAKYFPPASKAAVQKIVASLARRLRQADRRARLDEPRPPRSPPTPSCTR